MKNVIVTGANGFVGSHVVSELLLNGYEVYALDREGCCENLPDDPHCHFVPFELSNIDVIEKIIPSIDYEAMYHFAWVGSAGPLRADTQTQLNNAQWTVDCLRFARKVGCNRFIVAGSIMEHETISAVYTDGNRPGLGYIYGSGKLVAHAMCKSVAADIGIDLVWAEITNAYGIGERSPRLVNSTIKKCIDGVPPHFTSGTQNYDFVYVDDVARAFRLIGENGKPFNEYLIGSSTARPLKEFLLEMKRAIAPGLDFVFGDIPFTGIDLPIEKFNCKKTEEDTGFKATISFDEGCRKTYEWWKEIIEEKRQ